MKVFSGVFTILMDKVRLDIEKLGKPLKNGTYRILSFFLIPVSHQVGHGSPIVPQVLAQRQPDPLALAALGLLLGRSHQTRTEQQKTNYPSHCKLFTIQKHQYPIS